MNNFDKPRSNCGIVGIYGNSDAARLAYLGLYALQHRGQESAGIVSSDGEQFYRRLGPGLVSEVFPNDDVLQKLEGHIAVAHNRYSTTGGTLKQNIQPLLVNLKSGPFAISHNGNLTNSGELRESLVDDGALFQTTTDTEVICHLIARSRENELHDKINGALREVKGAYSLVMMSGDRLFAARDPHGVRPLNIGFSDNTFFVVSETCALDLVRAESIRDVEPGELVEISKEGIKSWKFASGQKRFACIFEYIYFARPDSRVFNENVDKVRRKLGKILAQESPAEADIVISVPDSSNTAAIGYSRRSGIKIELGLIRNHYVGRTFIQPKQDFRDFAVRVKFNTVKGVLKDRRVVVVEDSIVRATTLRQLVSLIKQSGAKEVHVRVSSPPIISPCYYGMDFPRKEELVAHRLKVAEIEKYIKCDSLAYLSEQGLLDAVSFDEGGYCTACFTGEYPIAIEHKIGKFQHEKNNLNDDQE
ncbi:amidophosphoribosyltransferase [candidate division KSB1 bacterium]|nr:amidophosphoribosyltransferase [candidate division KSB1 bacterium]